MQVGSKHSEETKRKMSDILKGHKVSEETKRKISINNGAHRPETKRKISVNNGSRRPEIRKKISEGLKGRRHSEETKRKMSEVKRGRYIGDKSPNWKGGASFLPYPPVFNNELKQFIKNRDSNECQNSYCSDVSKTLTIHHVDYDKDNCSQFNLITLCFPCNGKANNKHRWRRLYRKIIWSKYE